jgi:predicted house-cleaning NTP pyrophosphatase (Maf/HAM1 superfamily)
MKKKILVLKQDEKFLDILKRNFPKIIFEVFDEKNFFDEKKVSESFLKLKKSPNQIVLQTGLTKTEFLKEKFFEKNEENCDGEIFFLGLSSFIFLGRRILHNPESNKEALKQMKIVSGRRHRIYSGFCLISKNKIHLKENNLIIKFKNLNESEILKHVEEEFRSGDNLYDPLGSASKFINFVNGSYQAGLYKVPIFELNSTLLQYF